MKLKFQYSLFIEIYTSINKIEFRNLVTISFDSSYFKCNNVFNKPYTSCAMGSPSSPIFSNLFIQIALENIIHKLSFTLLFI